MGLRLIMFVPALLLSVVAVGAAAAAKRIVPKACKLVRSVTGGPGFVCAEHGYHGHVGFSLAMDDPPLSERFQPLTPGITRIPFGDFAAAEGAVGEDTAVIMETIPATAG